MRFCPHADYTCLSTSAKGKVAAVDVLRQVRNLVPCICAVWSQMAAGLPAKRHARMVSFI